MTNPKLQPKFTELCRSSFIFLKQNISSILIYTFLLAIIDYIILITRIKSPSEIGFNTLEELKMSVTDYLASKDIIITSTVLVLKAIIVMLVIAKITSMVEGHIQKKKINFNYSNLLVTALRYIIFNVIFIALFLVSLFRLLSIQGSQPDSSIAANVQLFSGIVSWIGLFVAPVFLVFANLFFSLFINTVVQGGLKGMEALKKSKNIIEKNIGNYIANGLLFVIFSQAFVALSRLAIMLINLALTHDNSNVVLVTIADKFSDLGSMFIGSVVIVFGCIMLAFMYRGYTGVESNRVEESNSSAQL